MAKKIQRNVAIEIYLPDGCPSLYVGRLVGRDETTITLVDVAWVANTGRRAQFFSGTPDSDCEIEPYPDGVMIELPSAGSVAIDWPHALLRTQR